MDVKVTITLPLGDGNLTGDVTAQITREDLGRAVLHYALTSFQIDDPGVDYYTDRHGNVYMGPHCNLGCYPRLALLVDTANLLMYGSTMSIDPVAQPVDGVVYRDPVYAERRQ